MFVIVLVEWFILWYGVWINLYLLRCLNEDKLLIKLMFGFLGVLIGYMCL